ncbi:RNA polymerase II transcriptional coactivator [Copidosoma floridanum]|uniref:RNA polymerase II transcriptional coactivator n=1 Tax=Copidosoma floridanum TaxID=29053 RepID=UPI0006C9472A|nr:RNA polymerase II transcriptional coactivator [Copidosoma floridanum]
MPKSKETISDSESVSDSGSEEEVKSKPKGKPQKVEKKKKQSSSEASSDSEEDSKSKKRQKKSADKGNAKKKPKKSDDEEEDVWELGGNKRVAVRAFKGKWFVDIREMYEKDGKTLPGKKGIALNFENWRELFKVADEINNCVKSK